MSESPKHECAYGGDLKLIFTCSGAADVGGVSDQAGRELTRQGAGKMFCLAGVGGRVPGIMDTTRSAKTILAIDGCSTHCVKECLLQAGFTQFEHLSLTELDMPKGKTEANTENINKVVAAAVAKLA
ncbi:putative zinc-binding protein [Candidatus Sumerlaeota bacterium]|nr:putative zinc-binding protein [Candidatus Sumerlaeota bacterium]